MTAAGLAELLVDAACAVVGATAVTVLLAAARELGGFWRDLLAKGVGW